MKLIILPNQTCLSHLSAAKTLQVCETKVHLTIANVEKEKNNNNKTNKQKQQQWTGYRLIQRVTEEQRFKKKRKKVQSETERGPECLYRINKPGSSFALKRRHTKTTTKT